MANRQNHKVVKDYRLCLNLYRLRYEVILNYRQKAYKNLNRKLN